jgi:hypothetical protein
VPEEAGLADVLAEQRELLSRLPIGGGQGQDRTVDLPEVAH